MGLMTRVCFSTSAATGPAHDAPNTSQMDSYTNIQTLHKALPAFSPVVPVALLPYIALVLLTITFVLAFYFSTLPKDNLPIRETAVASTASVLAGFGVVALFCTAGVYV